MMDKILPQLSRFRILPLIVADSDRHADDLGAAMVSAGLPLAEIAFRTPSAERFVQTIAKRGDMLVGAGTILSIEQADRAIDAGAQFLVAPGTNPKVVEHALKLGLPMVPGVA